MTRRTTIFALVATACLLGGTAAVVAGAFGKTDQKTDAKVGLAGGVVGSTRIQAEADTASTQPVSIPVSDSGGGSGSTVVVPPHPASQRPQALIVRAENPTDAALNGAVTTVPFGGGTPSVAKVFCERLYIGGPGVSA